MNSLLKTLAEAAVSLSRSPLGIIALFLVLVYGLACLVTGFSGAFQPGERLPLVYFLVGFPVLVLGVFAWLVSRHSQSLFGPGDFEDEKNWVKVQMAVVASLTAATAKSDIPATEEELERIIEVAQQTGRPRSPADVPNQEPWRNHLFWVDDRPNTNTYERQAFEAMGLRFSLCRRARHLRSCYRTSSPRSSPTWATRRGAEGYVLLDKIREDGIDTPLFFYTSSNAPEHRRETREHGGQGCTNNAQKLFKMVTGSVIKSVTRGPVNSVTELSPMS